MDFSWTSLLGDPPGLLSIICRMGAQFTGRCIELMDQNLWVHVHTVHQSFHSKYAIMLRNILFAFQTLRWSEMQMGLLCVVSLSGQQ